MVRPDPPSISHPADLAEALRRLPKGAKHAAEYVNLVKSILEYVLVPKHLKKIKTEKPIYGGRKRIDLFGRVGDTGFFSKLRSNHDIPAPYIHLECKNYSEDVGNPEFDQLKGRFSDKKGQFGILICRTVANEKAIIQRSQDATEANHYILVLTDVDLVRLIELREKDVDDDIDDFFAEMLEKVLL